MPAALHAALCVPRLEDPSTRPSGLLSALGYLGSALLAVCVGAFYVVTALRSVYAAQAAAGDVHVRRLPSRRGLLGHPWLAPLVQRLFATKQRVD